MIPPVIVPPWVAANLRENMRSNIGNLSSFELAVVMFFSVSLTSPIFFTMWYFQVSQYVGNPVTIGSYLGYTFNWENGIIVHIILSFWFFVMFLPSVIFMAYNTMIKLNNRFKKIISLFT